MYKLLVLIFLFVCITSRTNPQYAIGWAMVAGIFAIADSIQNLGE